MTFRELSQYRPITAKFYNGKNRQQGETEINEEHLEGIGVADCPHPPDHNIRNNDKCGDANGDPLRDSCQGRQNHSRYQELSCSWGDKNNYSNDGDNNSGTRTVVVLKQFGDGI